MFWKNTCLDKKVKARKTEQFNVELCHVSLVVCLISTPKYKTDGYPVYSVRL